MRLAYHTACDRWQRYGDDCIVPAIKSRYSGDLPQKV